MGADDRSAADFQFGIRLATANDTDTIVEMALALARTDDSYNTASIRNDWADEIIEAGVRDMLTQVRFDRALFVAEHGRVILGYVHVRESEGPDHITPVRGAELAELYVFPDFRGLGVGYRLIEVAKSWAWQRGFRKMILYVHTNNKAAQGLYKADGFTREYEMWEADVNG